MIEGGRALRGDNEKKKLLEALRKKRQTARGRETCKRRDGLLDTDRPTNRQTNKQRKNRQVDRQIQ